MRLRSEPLSRLRNYGSGKKDKEREHSSVCRCRNELKNKTLTSITIMMKITTAIIPMVTIITTDSGMRLENGVIF